MMTDTINQKLKHLEQQHLVKILYACESGSRAWGFASPDSDFDVRFIYARPLNDYLSINDKPDIVDLPVNAVLDINGWDVRKALKLFLKSNATLYEWLQSPVVYREDCAFADDLRSLMPSYFSPRAAANHYLSMAYNTLSQDLQADQVKLKRYFYALRPALACLWTVQKRQVPPMEFAPLRTLITDYEVQGAINQLMVTKQAAAEKAYIAPVALLNNWLEITLNYCREQIPQLENTKGDIAQLDAIFRKYLETV